MNDKQEEGRNTQVYKERTIKVVPFHQNILESISFSKYSSRSAYEALMDELIDNYPSITRINPVKELLGRNMLIVDEDNSTMYEIVLGKMNNGESRSLLQLNDIEINFAGEVLPENVFYTRGWTAFDEDLLVDELQHAIKDKAVIIFYADNSKVDQVAAKIALRNKSSVFEIEDPMSIKEEAGTLSIK